ncbi:MAG: 3-dehydroquinate dehydratase [Acholeplasmatales bacterium]|nr:3-dehydroquinate dehydratase [Acholeplasmatales bacterium]
MKTILVINGPNLNMLGRRPKEHYGSKTLDEINKMIADYDKSINFSFFQSNHEGAIIDRIQANDYDALIINPGAYTHTSVAIHDALEIVAVPKVEVHLSDVFNREDFRKIDFVKDVCDITITNLKEQGYIEAVKYLQKLI